MSDSGSLATIRAELASMAGLLDEQCRRVAALADASPADREGLIAAIYEAERAIKNAQRLVTRAEKLAG